VIVSAQFEVLHTDSGYYTHGSFKKCYRAMLASQTNGPDIILFYRAKVNKKSVTYYFKDKRSNEDFVLRLKLVCKNSKRSLNHRVLFTINEDGSLKGLLDYV
jgi:hypothetical protein